VGSASETETETETSSRVKLLAPGIRYPRPISRASLTTRAFLLLSLLSAAINTNREDAPLPCTLVPIYGPRLPEASSATRLPLAAILSPLHRGLASNALDPDECPLRIGIIVGRGERVSPYRLTSAATQLPQIARSSRERERERERERRRGGSIVDTRERSACIKLCSAALLGSSRGGRRRCYVKRTEISYCPRLASVSST